MKVFLAGTSSFLSNEAYEVPFVLESFFSFKEEQKKQIKTAEMFMLDSGAFSFMNSGKGNVDFDSYLDKYISFINENGIDYFFELDVDPIVGYEKVKEYRRILERKTGKQCIPVWHKSRGLDDFIETAKKYDYMAIGGIVTKEINRNEYRHFTRLIDIAHANCCKVHGLGFTSMELLPKYRFDSVDSTSWLNGGKYGYVYKFNGKTIKQYKVKGKRTIDYKIVNKHNLCEWIKFQRFADSYL